MHDHGPHAVACQGLDIGRPVVGPDLYDGHGEAFKGGNGRSVVAPRVDSRVERNVGRRRRHVLGHALDEGGVRRRREHAPDELPGVARKVALERLGERVQLLGGRLLVQRRVGVDPHDAGDPVAEPQRRLGHHIAAHRVADEDHPLEGQRIDDRDGVIAEGRHRPRGAPDPRFAVAGEVDRHDEMAGGERLSSAPASTCGRTTSRGRRRWPASRSRRRRSGSRYRRARRPLDSSASMGGRQGRMFWLSRNTLSGSQARLSATSRSYLALP